MVRNLVFLLGAAALVLLWWGAFHVFGMYTFLGMLVFLLWYLLSDIKPKFGKGRRQKQSSPVDPR